MRILFTSKKRGWSGEVALLQDLIEGCVAEGIDVTLGTVPDAELRRRLAGCPLRTLDLELLHEWWAVGALCRDVRRLRRALGEVDLVHTQASWDTWLVAWARVGLGRHVPMVRSRQNLKPIASHPSNRWLYGKSITRLVAASKTIEADLLRYPFISPERVRTVLNGIDPELFDPRRHPQKEARAALRADLGLAADAKVVAYVSRLTLRKQPEVFLQAARRLIERGSEACFLAVGGFVGSKEYAEGLRQSVADLGDRVRFLGFREDIPALLRACDAFVLPAPTEAFGLAPVEAMAMECPVVCADAAGLAETVVDGETGFLFEPGNAAACSDRIERLLADEELRLRMGRAGPPHVHAHFTKSHVLAGYLSCYRELVQTPIATAGERERGAAVGA